jgi:hypothetical protein
MQIEPGSEDLTRGNRNCTFCSFNKGIPIKNPISMKPKLVLLILSLSISSSIQTRAATLPDACGSDKVRFDLTLQKNPPAPSASDPGKGQIIFYRGQQEAASDGLHGQLQ